MKRFTIISGVLLFLIYSYVGIADQTFTRSDMTFSHAATLLFSSVFDVNLLFTAPIAFYYRRLPTALSLIIACNFLYYILGINMMEVKFQPEQIIIGMFGQMYVGLLLHRSRAFLQKETFLSIYTESNYFYKKFRINPIQWGWSKRLENSANDAAYKYDKYLVIPSLAGFLIFSVIGFPVVAFIFASLYIAVWLLHICLYCFPLLLIESWVRFFYSFFKTDRPKEMLNTTVTCVGENLAKLNEKIAEKDIPNKAGSWIKEGFQSNQDKSS